MSEREPDGSGRPHAMDGSAFDGPLDQTRYPPPRDNAAIIKGYLERIAYLEELNRRLERYAAFEAVGSIGNADGLVVIECRNCSQRRRMPVGTYEVLQRQTHERNGRVDL